MSIENQRQTLPIDIKEPKTRIGKALQEGFELGEKIGRMEAARMQRVFAINILRICALPFGTTQKVKETRDYIDMFWSDPQEKNEQLKFVGDLMAQFVQAARPGWTKENLDYMAKDEVIDLGKPPPGLFKSQHTNESASSENV